MFLDGQCFACERDFNTRKEGQTILSLSAVPCTSDQNTAGLPFSLQQNRTRPDHLSNTSTA